MVGVPQPLDQKFPLVKPDGTPTDYFIRWAQTRQDDIAGGITAAQAQQLIADWAAARQIIVGRALDGGGFLSADVTIDHAESLVVPGTYGDSTHVPQFVVDQEGHVQGVVLVPIAGGSSAWDFIPPAVADFPNFYSFDANNLVFNANDADVGLSLTNPTATTGTNKGRIATKALPAGGVDWSLTAKLGLNNGGASIAGIAIYESTTGKAIMFGADMGATSMSRAVYSYTGTLGTFGTIRLQQAQRASPVGFYRVARVGANLIFSVSPDGKHFVQILSETLVTDFTTAPDHIGFGVVNPAAATVPTIINCPYWVQSW